MMMKYLNTFVRHPLIVSLMPLSVFVFFAFILSQTAVFKDVENRWQSFFYDIKLVLPQNETMRTPPVYLVELDDQSLPDQFCRSPLSKKWLLDVLSVIGTQNPAVIGINFILENHQTFEDQNLRKKITDLKNVVILRDPFSQNQQAYINIAQSYGRMGYVTDSSGSVRFVCADANLCGCEGIKHCQQNRVFFIELLQNFFEPLDIKIPVDQAGWLKLNLPFYPSEAQAFIGTKPFTRISAHQLLKLPGKILDPDAIYIIGKEFKGLHQRYQVAAHSLSLSGVNANIMKLSANELLAAVTIMTLNQSFIKKIPTWISLIVLTLILLLIYRVSLKKESLMPLWIGLIAVGIWNICAALIFAINAIEIISVVPTITIILYAIYQIRTIQMREKIRKLALTNELESEKYNHLVDKFHTHSVFNALDSIRYLLRIKSEIAEEYLIKYSALLLGDLHHDPKQNYPLTEQWHYVQEFLGLLNLRNEKLIALNYQVGEELLPLMDRIKIPWKLFYPLVENAGKYTKTLVGRSHEVLPEININLDFKLSQKKIIFEIVNTYFDFETVSGSGSGLSNLKKRLDVLFPNIKCFLKSSGQNGVWRSVLEIPIEIQDLKDQR